MTANNEQAVIEAVNAQKLDQIIENVDELKTAVKALTNSVNRLAILDSLASVSIALYLVSD